MSDPMHTALQYSHQEILREMHSAFLDQEEIIAAEANREILAELYGQIQYHLGWFDRRFRPINTQSGKLLRPHLLLLSYALAWGKEQEQAGIAPTPPLSPRSALPAAAALELAHNFTLLHDDLQDGDTERRHRPTVWSIWGISQALLSGDALAALARAHLWKVLDEGVAPATALRLASLLDQTLLTLTEGQHLDLTFEQLQQVSLAGYEEMIARKTAALMACATEMGALLGTNRQDIITCLARFGHALGMAFQVRDDILGVWGTSDETGKQPAGDISRRKKSLPILHALQHALPDDRQILSEIYTQRTPITYEQVQQVLAIFARAQSREYCAAFLQRQCQQARRELAHLTSSPGTLTAHPYTSLQALVDFVERR